MTAMTTPLPRPMPPEPLASVIIPFYNQEQYVVECLESVARQQTRFPFEILAGDDCSTDRTRAVIEECRQRYPDTIRPISLEKNLGLVGNVERCEAAARGKYLAYCGGDDIWSHPEKLRKQVDFLEAHPDYGLVHCDYYELVAGEIVGPANASRGKTMPVGNIFEDLLWGNFIAALTACWRAELRQTLSSSPFSGPWLAEDYPRWLHASRQSLVGYLDEPLATYRVLKSSLSNNARKRLPLEISSWDLKIAGAKRAGLSTELQDRLVKCRNLAVIRYAMLAGDRALFKREYRTMRVQNPAWNRRWRNRMRALLMFAGLHRVVRFWHDKAG